MLQITIPEKELWNEKIEEFVHFNGCTIQMEHSLLSISKWESKWHKSFLSNRDRTNDEMLDYFRCMTVTQNVPAIAYHCLTQKNIANIIEYMKEPMTATTFSKQEGEKKNREIITAELIYYWMTVYNIPFECQKWHINKLMTLIKVCNVKSAPPKKMSQNEILKRNHALNKSRRKHR